MSQDALELMASIQRMADSGGFGGRHSEVLRLTGKPKGEDPQKREKGNSSDGSACGAIPKTTSAYHVNAACEESGGGAVT